VLSPSTQSIDLREKWLAYREIQSLQAYLIVWRDERRVRLHYRADDREWYDNLLGGESSFSLECPRMALSLGEIYEVVDLPAAEP
jgi:Uma2 family endonuclease